jgi:hypothetical protein
MATLNSYAKWFVFLSRRNAGAGFANCVLAQSAEEQAVLAPIHAMFDGMSKRDAPAIKAPTLPSGTMVLMWDGKPVQMTFEAFAERGGKPGPTQLKSGYTILWSGSITILPWCGRRSTFWLMGRWITAEQTYSILFASTGNGDCRHCPTGTKDCAGE